MKRQTFHENWYTYKDGKKADRKQIRLPHDAMLEEERIPDLIEGAASGYFPGGRYIYEKHFFIEETAKGQTFMLEFEGIYQKSEVFLNDVRIGGWIYGYTGFLVDLTAYLRYGEENHLRVIADNSQTPNSRWYTGSGIYRPVHLLTGGKDYIKPDGILVTTLSDRPARIRVDIGTSDDAGLADRTEFQILREKAVIAEGKGLHAELEIPNAALWSEQSPALYQIHVWLKDGEKIVDEADECFGIRKLEWNAKDGLTCNGKTLKLRGGCIHHDNGPLGACEFRDAAYRRIRLLKKAGYNAVRSAHNPISRALLQACDELGMYVMDETFDVWLTKKNEYDYSLYFEKEWEKDVAAMVAKDYNHPSVILYSIGNEISDIGGLYAEEIHRQMADYCRRLDLTRPVTNAVNIMAALSKPKKKKKPVYKRSAADVVDPKRKATRESMVGSKLINNIVTFMPFIISMATPEKVQKNLKNLMEHEDIVGFNYGDRVMEGLHRLEPEYLLLNTETFPKSIGDNWPVIEKENCYVGDFMWTAWDYLGEAGIGVVQYGKQKKQFNKPYPCIGAGIGSLNLIGDAEAQAYYAAAVWGQLAAPYIGVRPLDHAGEKCVMGQWRGTDVTDSWTWPGCEGKNTEVHVFGSCETVELFLNGRSLGKKKTNKAVACFLTVYEPGTITAVCYDVCGRKTGEHTLITAGAEHRLLIRPEKETYTAGKEELAFVQISLTDENGILRQSDDKKLEVTVSGKGTLYRLGSGNPVTDESYLEQAFTTWHGRLLAVIRLDGVPGKIRIGVRSSDGMYQGCCTFCVEK